MAHRRFWGKGWLPLSPFPHKFLLPTQLSNLHTCGQVPLLAKYPQGTSFPTPTRLNRTLTSGIFIIIQSFIHWRNDLKSPTSAPSPSPSGIFWPSPFPLHKNSSCPSRPDHLCHHLYLMLWPILTTPYPEPFWDTPVACYSMYVCLFVALF